MVVCRLPRSPAVVGSLYSYPASCPAAELRTAALAENPTVLLSLELGLGSQPPPGDLASSSLRSCSALSMNLGISYALTAEHATFLLKIWLFDSPGG